MIQNGIVKHEMELSRSLQRMYEQVVCKCVQVICKLCASVYVFYCEGAQANNRVHTRKADKMKVKLQEVLEALEGAGMETAYYYDTRNEEILMVFDGMINGEYNPELMEEISEGFIEENKFFDDCCHV